MTCSPARLLANQANARRSTGPRTPEGKARSRANALKHGLTGEGIALPSEDAAEVDRRFDDLRAELKPSGTMGRILARRIAFLSVRLERCERQEAAHLGEKVRHAQDDHDLRSGIEAAALLEALGDDPGLVARKLLRTPEGVDATLVAWLDLKADLVRARPRSWTAAHCERANNLIGRRSLEVTASRIDALSQAIWGDFGLLAVDEGPGLDDDGRKEWARAGLVALIDEELQAVREHRETLDLDAFALDRDEAGSRALFDTSKEANLARRYEAAAERGMFRALEEFREVERDALANPQAAPAPPPGPLGSFGPGVDVLPEEPDEPPVDPTPRPVAPPRPAPPGARVAEFATTGRHPDGLPPARPAVAVGIGRAATG